MLQGEVDHGVEADEANRAKGRPDLMKYALEDAHEEEDSIKEKTKPGEYMEKMMVILWLILMAFTDESLTVGWTRKPVVNGAVGC